ncbi:hypothetical protein BKA70DRAFT_1323636, partial [Coprinopsis sp. MPI-PUGE-AT-0042]
MTALRLSTRVAFVLLVSAVSSRCCPCRLRIPFLSCFLECFVCLRGSCTSSSFSKHSPFSSLLHPHTYPLSRPFPCCYDCNKSDTPPRITYVFISFTLL